MPAPAPSSTRRRAPSGQPPGRGKNNLACRALKWFEQHVGLSIQLRGRGLRAHVVLQKPVSAAQDGPQKAGGTPVSDARQTAMSQALRHLLAQHPQTKTLLRHLAYVEHTLRHHGLAATEALPVDLLAKALAQLESLVTSWSVVGLADLRSHLSLLVKSQEVVPSNLPLDAQPTNIDSIVMDDVSEVSQSEFLEIERSWNGQMPPTLDAEWRRREK